MPNDAELDAIAAALTEGSGGEQTPPAEEQEQASPPDTQEATAESDTPVEVQEDAADSHAESGDAEFYQRNVPGTDYTVGELKDMAKELVKSEEIRASLEDERSDFRNQRMQFTRTAQFLQQSGMQLSEEQQSIMEQYRTAGLQMEKELIEAGIPEWKSDKARTADVEEIAQSWARYGVTKGEIDELLKSDARFAKREHDRLVQDRRLADAQAKVQKAKPKKAMSPGKTAPKNQKSDLMAMADDSSVSAEDRQLAAFLGGQMQ